MPPVAPIASSGKKTLELGATFAFIALSKDFLILLASPGAVNLRSIIAKSLSLSNFLKSNAE